MAMLAILILPLSMLGFTAHRRRRSKDGHRRHRPTQGPHGFSEMLYAYVVRHGQ